MCTPADGTYTITYTASANNPAACPPAAATENLTWPPDSGDSFQGCTCADSTQTCTTMRVTDAGVDYTQTTTFTFTSTNFSGTATYSFDAGMCDYTFTGTM
jgi:hypothetical protein